MSVQSEFGHVIATGPNYIVREKLTGGKVVLTVHLTEDGKELLPNAYLLGSNRLEFPFEACLAEWKGR
jgi:hypothetical protein